MSSTDNRLIPRLLADRLPPGLRLFFVSRGNGFEECHAEVCDASEEGMGLLVSCPAEELERDYALWVRDQSGEIRLLARIVHVSPQEGETCRIGIRFRDGKNLERYRNLIRNVTARDGIIPNEW